MADKISSSEVRSGKNRADVREIKYLSGVRGAKKLSDIKGTQNLPDVRRGKKLADTKSTPTNIRSTKNLHLTGRPKAARLNCRPERTDRSISTASSCYRYLPEFCLRKQK